MLGDKSENMASENVGEWTRPVGSRFCSEVWKYFKINEAKNKVMCSKCPSILAFNGSTSAPKKHLESIHHIKINKAQRCGPSKANEDSSPGSVASQNQPGPSSDIQNTLNPIKLALSR